MGASNQGLYERGDMVSVGRGHGPVFRYLKGAEAGVAWLEVPFTGRVFRFPLVLLRLVQS